MSADELHCLLLQNGVVACPLISSPDNNLCTHAQSFATCTRCKGKAPNKRVSVWLLDSGASRHFTYDMSDFVHYETLEHKQGVQTANGHVVYCLGKGTVVLRTDGNSPVIVHPVYYIPDLSTKLLSLGELLKDGLSMCGTARCLELLNHTGKTHLRFLLRFPGDTVYVVKSRLETAAATQEFMSVYALNCETMHRSLGHPSREVLRRARKNTQDFPNFQFPPEDPKCPGCAKGKMSDDSHPSTPKHATKPCELIHCSESNEYTHRYRYPAGITAAGT